MKKRRRKNNGVNAGSMADIAFLLLIFFLVATTIAQEKGLKVILPPYYEGEPGKASDRNVLSIRINADNKVMVEGQESRVEDLSDLTYNFIINPLVLSSGSLSPDKAVVSLIHDARTEYQPYLMVYSAIENGNDRIWEEEAQKRHRSSFNLLSVADRNSIRMKYPRRISEADPIDFSLIQ